MATNSANIDSISRSSVHEYTDMRHREYCEMLNQPNEQIAQLNRLSSIREYIELHDVPSDHQYERVPCSVTEENVDKSKVNLQLIKQIFIVILVIVIVIAVVMLCIIMAIFITNMLSEQTNLSKANLSLNLSNKNDSKFTSPIKLHTSPTTASSSTGPTIVFKREFVKEMMLDSWNAYLRYAWGHEEVSTFFKKVWASEFGNNSGLTLVNSMSTLWIMELKDEFERGKKWIATELDLAKLNQKVRVYDVIVNYVGGLLSCYALTNEQLFLNKALTIAQLVEPAFNSSTGMPYWRINLRTSKLFDYQQRSLSYVIGYQLDFNYLSDASGKQQYRKQIQKIQNVLKEIEKPKKLYFNYIDVEGKWESNMSSLFRASRKFYASLVKSFVQSNHLDVQSIQMYKEAMDAVEAVKMFVVSSDGLHYARSYDYRFNSFCNSMEFSGCYLGAMLSLGATAMARALEFNSSIGDKDKVVEQNRIARHWNLAEQITRTCQQTSDETKSGLGPAAFTYKTTTNRGILSNDYGLSPELAESNFILWRLTHKPKYRDNAWKMIHRHCRVKDGGYAGIGNVNQPLAGKHVTQSPIFLSATLKYLYLTFTDDSVLSLDQWVFNSVGHPLPICGNNTIYPSKQCKS